MLERNEKVVAETRTQSTAIANGTAAKNRTQTRKSEGYLLKKLTCVYFEFMFIPFLRKKRKKAKHSVAEKGDRNLVAG